MSLPDSLHVLHLDRGRVLRGGQKQILLLLHGLQKRGIRVTLVSSEEELAAKAREQNISIRTLPLRGEWDSVSAWNLAKLVHSEQVSLVHTHDSACHGIARLSQVLGMKCPLVVHRRVDFFMQRHVLNRWKYLKGAAGYIVVARSIGKRLEYLGVSSDRIYWVPSSVDLQSLDTEEQASYPASVIQTAAKDKLITCIGALEKEKGQDLLIASIPELLRRDGSLRFCFLGEGRDRKRMMELAQSLGVADRCDFPGYVTPIAPVLCHSFCVVLPTLSEGCSPAALESMALGKPVIASATGGLLDLIQSGETGLLFTPGDLDQMQLAIRRILDDPELGSVLGNRAREWIRTNFSSEKMVERTLEVYENILHNRK